jgi:hypothetical protein
MPIQITLPKYVKLVIFSYLSANNLLFKVSKLNHQTRELFREYKESSVLSLKSLKLLTPKKIIAFDESYLINFAPLIDLTLKCKGQD